MRRSEAKLQRRATDAFPDRGMSSPDNSRQISEQMIDSARFMWRQASEAVEEALSLRMNVEAQLEQLASNHGFRERYVMTMLPAILNAAIEATHANMGNIQLLNPATGQLKIKVQQGFERPFLQFFNSVHAGQAACGSALKMGQRIIVPDVTDSPVFRATDSLEVMLDARVRSVQSTPLLGEGKQVLGVLSTHYRSPHVLSHQELRRLDYLSAWASTLLEWLKRRPSTTNKPTVAEIRDITRRVSLISNTGVSLVARRGKD